MWILVTAFCATFPAGDKCNAVIPPTYFAHRDICESSIEAAEQSVVGATEIRGGALFFFEARCVEVERAQGTAL